VAGQAAGSQDRYRLCRSRGAALLPRDVAGAPRSLVRENRRLYGERRTAIGASACRRFVLGSIRTGCRASV
jgi:hypothetical protein